MRYKARDNIYNQKHYKKGEIYAASELPQRLSREELDTLFQPLASPAQDGEYAVSDTDGTDGDTEEAEPIVVTTDGVNIPAEHTNLLELAAAHGIKASINWKPETIIKKLEEKGLSEEELVLFKSIDWSLELEAEDSTHD